MSPFKQDADSPVRNHRERPQWIQAVVAIPATVLPLLPSFSCPVCLAAYAGVLSTLGLGFLLTDRVQRPIIVFFLVVTLVSVAWSARRHRRFGPVGCVFFGSLAVVAGRIVWASRPVLYAGVLCLVIGTFWNLFLKRRSPLERSLTA